MNTRSRLFLGGTLGALALTLALNCNNDPNNNGGGGGNADMRGGGNSGDGGNNGDGGGNNGDGGGNNPDGFNPGGINLTGVSPSLAPTTGGTVLTLSGTNFPSDATVFIDNKQATIQGAVTAGQIMVQAPADPGKKGKVTVEIRRQSTIVATNSNLFSYYFGTLGFSVPKSYNTGGTGPQAVALVDLNANGRLDAVVANFTTSNVSVLLGQGGDSFGASATFSTGTNSRPAALTVADFDNDGKPDIATVNSSAENVAVLLGDGMGLLGTAKTRALATGTAPQGIAAGKFNGDGYADVATANSATNNISILLGAAGGMLGVPTNLATDPDNMKMPVPNATAVVDMNKDGKMDLLVVNKFTSQIAVLLGDGAGGFTLKGNYNTGTTGPLEMAVADYNGDGYPDVAATLDLIAAPKVSVLLGQADGSLTAGVQYAVSPTNGDAPKGLAAGDLNGDGLADLVVTLYATDKVSVLLAQQGGVFGSPTMIQVGNAPRGVAIGDLDSDGNLDVVVANYSDNQIAILLNKFQ